MNNEEMNLRIERLKQNPYFWERLVEASRDRGETVEEYLVYWDSLSPLKIKRWGFPDFDSVIDEFTRRMEK